MEYFELTPQQEAAQILGSLNVRIGQIQRYKLEDGSKESIDFDSIINRLLRIDTNITLPLVNGTMSWVDSILENEFGLMNNVREVLIQGQPLFSSTEEIDSSIEDKCRGIVEELNSELKDYKKKLSSLEEQLELIGIKSSINSSLKLQWNISLTLLADLFKVLRAHKSVKEDKEGELTSFIASNFSVPKSPKISKGSLSSKMSGSLNDEKAITKFLNDLIKTASNM